MRSHYTIHLINDGHYVTYLQTLFSVDIGTGLSHYGIQVQQKIFKFGDLNQIVNLQSYTVDEVYYYLLYASHNIVDIGEFIFPYLLLLF